MFEINVQAIAAFQEIGRGLEVIKSFPWCINRNSISDPTEKNINEQLEIAANSSMKRVYFKCYLLINFGHA